VVLSGARSLRELEANVAAAERGGLPRAVLDRLGEIAGIAPSRPYEEPAILPFGQPYLGPGPL
jgi:hypothetical protein